MKCDKAYGYLSEEAAEKAAFRLVIETPDLIGELEVAPFKLTLKKKY